MFVPLRRVRLRVVLGQRSRVLQSAAAWCCLVMLLRRVLLRGMLLEGAAV